MFSIRSAIGVPVVTWPFSRVHHARQDFHLIGFLPLGGEPRLTGTAAIEVALDLFNR